MITLKVCPRCQGEGEMRIPQYGVMVQGKWDLPKEWSETIEGGETFKVVGDCKPCRSTGYLKVAS